MASNLNIHSKLVQIFATRLFHNGITKGMRRNKTPALLELVHQTWRKWIVITDKRSASEHKTPNAWVGGIRNDHHTLRVVEG